MVKILMPGLEPSVPCLAGTSGKFVKNMRMYSAHSSLGLLGAYRKIVRDRPLLRHRVDVQRTNGYFQLSQLGLYNGTGMKIKKHIGHVRVLVDNSHKIF